MSEFNIEVDGGKTVRLTTAGKYCDRDILVTASGEETGSYDKGFADGKQAEYDRFWDTFQDNGNRTNYSYAFYGEGWTDENFNPKYPIKPGRYEAPHIFDSTGITDFTREGIVLDFSDVDDARWLFTNTKNTEIKLPVINLSWASAGNECFNNYWGKDLSLIVSERMDLSTSFGKCIYLENLIISGTIGKSIGLKDSNLLSNESIQSVIDALKDLTGATAQTITFHATVGAKLTDEQKATITAKNWTLVY